MKNSNETVGNQTRNLPACSPAPQPPAPLRTPTTECKSDKSYVLIYQVKLTVATLLTDRNVYLTARYD